MKEKICNDLGTYPLNPASQFSAGEEIVEDDANNRNEEDRKEEIKKQLIDDEEEDRKLLDSIPDESMLF